MAVFPKKTHKWPISKKGAHCHASSGKCKSEPQWDNASYVLWWWFSRQVVSDSCDPMDCGSARFLSPWDFPGKNTGVGCHSLLQGDHPDLGVETRSPTLQADSLPTEPTREAWYLLEWLILKRQELTSIDEDVKKRVPLFTVDGNVDGSSHHGKQHGGSLKSQQSHFWVYIKRKWNSYFEEVAVHLSSAVLFTIAKLWK